MIRYQVIPFFVVSRLQIFEVLDWPPCFNCKSLLFAQACHAFRVGSSLFDVEVPLLAFILTNFVEVLLPVVAQSK